MRPDVPVSPSSAVFSRSNSAPAFSAVRRLFFTGRLFRQIQHSFVHSAFLPKTSIPTDDPDLRFQLHAVFFINSVLHQIFQLQKSAAEALPVLMRKPACFSETCAPPTLAPFSPASSMSFPAKYPSGRLKKLPAEG